jgi:hypothetical protein
LLCKAQCGELTTGIIFSENGKHLITTSSLGVIYVWKLPEEVSKLLVKKKIVVGELDSIDEDEMEDSVRRGGSSAPNSSPFDKSQNVKSELDDIFAQIG